MSKHVVQGIVLHTPPNSPSHSLANRVSEFHAEVIERRLKQTNLTTEQQVAVLDRILTNLRAHEVEGVIG